jgi:hypothetical protein
MPTAPQYLKEKWDAFELYELFDKLSMHSRFIEEEPGHIRPLPGVVPTEEEVSILEYLFREWDFEYVLKAKAGRPPGAD